MRYVNSDPEIQDFLEEELKTVGSKIDIDDIVAGLTDYLCENGLDRKLEYIEELEEEVERLKELEEEAGTNKEYEIYSSFIYG